MISLVFSLLTTPVALARVEVKSLATPKALYELNRKEMYAIGRAETPGDAITILNGRIYVTHFESTKGKPVLRVNDSFKTRATALDFSNVHSWNEAPLAGQERNSGNLGPLINKVLKDSGYELPGRFPFLIKGKIGSIQIAGETTEKMPVKISERRLSGVVIGFLTKSISKDQQPEFKLDMNFVDDAGKVVGTVEYFTIDAKNNATLFVAR